MENRQRSSQERGEFLYNKRKSPRTKKSDVDVSIKPNSILIANKRPETLSNNNFDYLPDRVGDMKGTRNRYANQGLES